MPSGLAIGILLPDLAAALKPTLSPLVVLLLLMSMLRVSPASIGAAFGRLPLLGGAWVWALLAAPFVALVIGEALHLPRDLRDALTVSAAAPPLLFGAMFAAVVGLDAGLALVTVLGGTMIAALTLPFVAALAGLDLGDVTTGEFLLRSIAIVVGTALAAWLVRRIAGEARLQANAKILEGIGVLLMIVFAIAVMDGIAALAFAEPWRLAAYIAAAFALNASLQIASAAIFWRTGKRTAGTLAVATGYRNNALLLAILPPPLPPEILLFVAAAQFPIYIVPSLAWPLYTRAAKG
jgi:predicted Na+-dependent transporter